MKKVISWTPVVSASAVLGVIYLVWLAACWQLGRRPVPMMDDPAYVGGLVDRVLGWTDNALIAFLFCYAAGTAFSAVVLCLPKTKDRKSWARNVAVALLCGVMLLILVEHSPASAVQWYLD
ncbi:MAG: hypothetical protein QM760_10940 [Nibricoccus sp.]